MTVTNIKNYRKLQQTRINILKKGKRRGPITAAKFMAAQLRKLAPYSKGNVRNSIRRSKNSVRVSGTDPRTGFPYIHWLNATPGSGLERIRLKFPFGDGSIKSYADVAKTGTPGFFWIAERKSAKFYRDIMLRNTRNALMAKI